jgi:RNA polymerase primary sigma factor
LTSKNDKDLSLLEILGTNDSEKIEKDIYKKQIIDKILQYVKEHCAERTYEIFRMRYGLDEYKDKEFTYKEIGEKFDISQERVRQVLAKVLKDVKKYLKANNIIESKIDQNLQN